MNDQHLIAIVSLIRFSSAKHNQTIVLIENEY